ncbi:hypothetical protein [Acetobacter okinawensis]|nr:hypothetical protein [Acetobacter okinawensis]
MIRSRLSHANDGRPGNGKPYRSDTPLFHGRSFVSSARDEHRRRSNE